MSKTNPLNVPHQPFQDEARRRIQAGIEGFRRQYAAQVGQVEEHWTGSHLEGRCMVMGQTIGGGEK